MCLGWSPGGWGEGGLHALCGFSEMFWGLLALPGRTGEIYRSQEASQVHETPQHLAGAFRNCINQPPIWIQGVNLSFRVKVGKSAHWGALLSLKNYKNNLL